jgi:hypothetical protein
MEADTGAHFGHLGMEGKLISGLPQTLVYRLYRADLLVQYDANIACLKGVLLHDVKHIKNCKLGLERLHGFGQFGHRLP